MSGRLSVTVKNELKELIIGQLAEMAEAINSEHEPELRIIEAEARQAAITSFGLECLVAEGDEIIKQRAELLHDLQVLQEKQDELLSKPEDNHRYCYTQVNDRSGASSYLSSLLPARTEHHKSILFAESDFGKRLLSIKAKTKSISKDILLATMPEQLTAVYLAFCADFGIDE